MVNGGTRFFSHPEHPHPEVVKNVLHQSIHHIILGVCQVVEFVDKESRFYKHDMQVEHLNQTLIPFYPCFFCHLPVLLHILGGQQHTPECLQQATNMTLSPAQAPALTMDTGGGNVQSRP